MEKICDELIGQDELQKYYIQIQSIKAGKI